MVSPAFDFLHLFFRFSVCLCFLRSFLRCCFSCLCVFLFVLLVPSSLLGHFLLFIACFFARQEARKKSREAAGKNASKPATKKERKKEQKGEAPFPPSKFPAPQNLRVPHNDSRQGSFLTVIPTHRLHPLANTRHESFPCQNLAKHCILPSSMYGKTCPKTNPNPLR